MKMNQIEENVEDMEWAFLWTRNADGTIPAIFNQFVESLLPEKREKSN